MNRYRFPMFFISLLFIFSLVISACGSAPSEMTATPTDAGPIGKIFTLVGPNGGNILTLAQLKSLPVTEGQAGIKSSTGQITIPEPFTGVAFKDLVAYLNVPFRCIHGGHCLPPKMDTV